MNAQREYASVRSNILKFNNPRLRCLDVAMSDNGKLRQAVKFVAVSNFAYFFVEFVAAIQASSVSLFADSIDFLEDASVNLLILMALNWSVQSRARLGKIFAFVLMAPAIATLWTAISKFTDKVEPSSETLTIVGAGALIVNAVGALKLASFRKHSGSLTKTAFLSARNDVYANLAIIAAGFVTAATHSFWPDLIVGIGIGIMNADAAKEIWQAASKEAEPVAP